MNIKNLILILFVSLLSFSCSSKTVNSVTDVDASNDIINTSDKKNASDVQTRDTNIDSGSDQNTTTDASIFDIGPVPVVDKEAMMRTITALASPAHAGRFPGSEGITLSRTHILERLKTFSPAIETFKINHDGNLIEGNNIIVTFPGNGKLANEILVILAHYDHLGSHRTDYYAGAQDNAGGVAALLEIANDWKNFTPPSKRTLLVIFPDGEEMGLLGSKAWIEKHADIRSNIIAGISVDGFGGFIGPSHKNAFAIGTDTADAIHQSVKKANTLSSFQSLTFPYYVMKGRSDHAVFYEKEIPALHFSTGISPDVYHLPNDTIDKINEDLLKPATIWLAYLFRTLATQARPIWAPDSSRTCSDSAASFVIFLEAFDKDSTDPQQKKEIATAIGLIQPFANQDLTEKKATQCDTLLRYIYSQIESKLP